MSVRTEKDLHSGMRCLLFYLMKARSFQRFCGKYVKDVRCEVFIENSLHLPTEYCDTHEVLLVSPGLRAFWGLSL